MWTMMAPAPLRRHSLQQEVRVLLVHGLLHLLGHDHEEGPAEEAAMAAAEAAIMTQLGWGDRGGLIASAQAGLGTSDPASAGAPPRLGAAHLIFSSKRASCCMSIITRSICFGTALHENIASAC